MKTNDSRFEGAVGVDTWPGLTPSTALGLPCLLFHPLCMGACNDSPEICHGQFRQRESPICSQSPGESLHGPYRHRPAPLQLSYEPKLDHVIEWRLTGSYRPFLEPAGICHDKENINHVSVLEPLPDLLGVRQRQPPIPKW